MATLQTQTVALKAGNASGGTSTFTMEEGHWEIIKVDGYLTSVAAVAADITVSRNGTAVSGAMRVAAAGASLVLGAADASAFSWDAVDDAEVLVQQGDVITVASTGTASVTFVHLRRR